MSEKYGVESNGWIKPETIEKIFNDFNTDKNLKVLFDRIKEQVNDLGVYFGEFYGEEEGTDGFYRHDSFNDIRLNIDGLLTAARTRQDFASVILHEMLHPLTSDIIAMYQKGHADKLTKSQAEAAKNVVDIYNRLKSLYKEKGWKEPYALTNPREMMTELANPSWREALQGFEEGRSIWRKILDSVRKFFGFAPTRPGLSDLNKALDNVLNNFGKEQFDFATRHSKELFGKEPQGHKVTDPDEIKRLEEEPKIKVYRAMQVIDGKLYPPMAASVGGKLVEANELGQWIRADENPDLAIPDIDPKTGKQKVDKKTGELKWKFKLDKGGKDATGKKATDVNAAYNPYWHLSRSPLNDQFKSAWIRPNIVIVECEVPASELTSGYKAERAKDAVGEVDWKSGSVSGEVFKQTGRARKVILSRWCKPVRVLSDAEVAQRAKEFIGDAKVEIPENILTPKQRIAFEKAGFKIGAPEKGVKKSEQIMEALEKGLTIDNTVLSDDGTKFRAEDPQEIELPKDEYAVLSHTIDSSHKNYKRGKINYEYTAEYFYLFKYNTYNAWNVYQKIPIDGNEELIISKMESKKKLSKIQEILIQLLKQAGMDETGIIGTLLLIKDDEEAQIDLARYLHFGHATEDQVMNVWVKNYLIAHPQRSTTTSKE